MNRDYVHPLDHYHLSPLHFHPTYHVVEHYKRSPPLILAATHTPTHSGHEVYKLSHLRVQSKHIKRHDTVPTALTEPFILT